MIEVMFAVRKDGFKDHPVILEGLDLVEEDDQFTHMLPLEDDYNPEDVLSKSGVVLSKVFLVSHWEVPYKQRSISKINTNLTCVYLFLRCFQDGS